MSYFYLRTTRSHETRVIVSVSKKISKSAVTRNTIKRRVRPIMRALRPFLKKETYFVIAKPGAEKIKGEELEKELKLLIVNRKL